MVGQHRAADAQQSQLNRLPVEHVRVVDPVHVQQLNADAVTVFVDDDRLDVNADGIRGV